MNEAPAHQVNEYSGRSCSVNGPALCDAAESTTKARSNPHKLRIVPLALWHVAVVFEVVFAKPPPGGDPLPVVFHSAHFTPLLSLAQLDSLL